jgi:outer membrane immunogenic protein
MTSRKDILGLALAGTFALGVLPVTAADLSTAGGGYKDGPAVTPWAGFYIGINGGAGWAEDRLAFHPTTFTGVTPGGGFGGGQIGYNWQSAPSYWTFTGNGSLVLGVEADLQGSGFQDRLVWAGSAFSQDLGYFGTVRGRVGLATDRSLFYVTGGFAYGGLKSEAIIGPNDFRFDATATGFAAGGGIEMKLGRNFSGKIEYQYINLGPNDPVTAGGKSYFANGGKSTDDDFHTIRAGLNYFVAAAYEPLK